MRIALGITLAVLWTGSAAAERSEDPSRLAPGPDELVTSLERAELLLDEAAVIGQAASRLQNAFGQDRVLTTKVACNQTKTMSYGARAQVYGQAHRDQVQTASAEVDRLERLAAAPTVAPSMDPELTARVEAARARVDAAIRDVRVQAAWHERYILPRILQCRPPLLPAAGVTGWQAPGTAEPVAIVGTRGGVICPMAVPANGKVVIAWEGEACWDRDADCYCSPKPVLPGAVLGEDL